MRKIQILIKKPVDLVLLILDLSKTVMYKSWYDYVKLKYGENIKLCYMGTGGFIVHVKTDNIYKDIAEDVEKRCDTLNFELNRPLPKVKSKNIIGLIKYGLGGKNHDRICWIKSNNI